MVGLLALAVVLEEPFHPTLMILPYLLIGFPFVGRAEVDLHLLELKQGELVEILFRLRDLDMKTLETLKKAARHDLNEMANRQRERSRGFELRLRSD